MLSNKCEAFYHGQWTFCSESKTESSKEGKQMETMLIHLQAFWSGGDNPQASELATGNCYSVIQYLNKCQPYVKCHDKHWDPSDLWLGQS